MLRPYFILILVLMSQLTECRGQPTTNSTSLDTTTVRTTPVPTVVTPTMVAETHTPISVALLTSTVVATVSSTAEVVVPVATATLTLTHTPSPPLVAAQPVRLQIPIIEVDAAIESVGKDSDGNMAVPEGVENVGWYNLGARPGEEGSAVMAGHLDNYLQQPAVFWRLEELQAGDTITVTDQEGTEYTFSVTGSETYQYNQAPIAKIFGSDGTPTLQLITCRGLWDSAERNYNERLVIYSRLVSYE